jgi:7-cyano-7-deazaguanine synthase
VPAASRASEPLAVALVSGGLDSCVAAAVAARTHALACLHLNYRQRTERRELVCFERVADHFGARLRLVVDVSFMEQIGGTSLIGTGIPVPEGGAAPGQVPSTYVPFRNANLLGVAVAWAEVIGAEQVFIGAHEQDSAYPDCRRGFFEAYNRMVAAGTRPSTRLAIRTPLLDLGKAGIVRLGLSLGAPLHLTWSCYQQEDRPCGRCQSCRLRRAGFEGAGVVDPLLGG